MNILFLHPNFPAQFRSPCQELAKNKDHDVKFVCQTHYGRHLKGVEKLVLKGKGSQLSTQQSSKREHERSMFRAEVYRKSFELLIDRLWIPDVVIAHSGWGCGLYVKEIWPQATFISYLEWWFDPKSELVNMLKKSEYFNFNQDTFKNLWLRNMPLAMEMSCADHIVTPTEWQKNQLPLLLKKNCTVIYDSINHNLFFSDPSKLSLEPVITYGTRGMEPMRGFPQFIKILPELLLKWPQLKVQIAGDDTVSYGGLPPKDGSWKQWALNLLNSKNLSHRVEWMGLMPLAKYVEWLKSTWCHIYLSEPFVTSWSFIEANYCNIPIVASDTEATREFAYINSNLCIADHNNKEELVAAINSKIRFFGIPANSDRHRATPAQFSDHDFPKNANLSLAAFIADAEATTKV